MPSWVHEGARGWLVAGPVECARDVLREVGARAPRGGVVALTLEGTSTTARAPALTVIGTQAGVVPARGAESSDAMAEDVRAYMTQFAARPSWWTALGRDAGALARKAVVSLPLGAASDAATVTRRRAVVNAELSAAKIPLWTSETDAFAADQTLKRTLHVVELAR